MQVNQEQVSRREKVLVEQHGDHVHQERIVEDISLAYRQAFIRVTQLIWLFFGTIDGLIGIRVLLKLIAANTNNGFTSFVYQITDLFVWPFINITGSPSFQNYVLEVSSIIAMMVYMLVAWIIVRLVWIVFYHPPVSHVSVYDQEEVG